MTPEPSVLIFDAANESTEVLSAALGREGIGVYTADRAEQAVALLWERSPVAVLVDTDCLGSEEAKGLRALCEAARRKNAPIVSIGAKRNGNTTGHDVEFVRKPYQYGRLVRRICESVSGTRHTARRAA